MTSLTKHLTTLGAAGLAALALTVPALTLPTVIAPASGVRQAAASPGSGTQLGGHAVPKVRKLSGSVGPSFDISMNRSRTRPGMYDITIRDLSTAHNFHLTGRGVDKKTPVGRAVTKVWHVRLRVGTYRFQCDMHPNQMFGHLRVVAPAR
jgi:hypothetical protein